MTKKTRILGAFFLLLLVVNLTATGVLVYRRCCEGGGLCGTEKPGRGFERLKKELALTSSQTQAMMTRRDVFHVDIEDLTEKTKEERRLLVAELEKDGSDPVQLEKIAARINRLQLEAQNRTIRHLLEVKALFNREQRKTFFRIVLERFESGGDRGEGAYLRGR